MKYITCLTTNRNFIRIKLPAKALQMGNLYGNGRK